jgi:hypothetical protein
MATYVFGGGPVQPSQISYISINLNANIVLNWPISYLDTVNVVGRAMDVIPTAGGHTLTLPDARFVGTGTSIMMNNRSGFAFNLLRNDGSLLQAFAPGNILFFYLIDTTTAAGTWITVPFGGGVAAVTFVDAVSTSPATLAIAGVPIVNAGTITFTPGAELVGLQALAAFGYVVRTAAGTYASRSFIQGANMVLTNPNGVAGATTIALTNTLAGILSAQIGNLSLVGNTFGSTNANGDINIAPNGNGNVNVTTAAGDITLASGAGEVNLGLLSYPQTDAGTPGLVPITSGAQALRLGRIAANNLIINGGFQIWNYGANYNVTNAFTYTTDRWQLGSNGGVIATVNNPAAPEQFSAEIGRQNGNAAVGQVIFGQTMLISTCAGAVEAGFISYSFIASAAAGFSAAGNTLVTTIITGTGNNDVSALSTGFAGAVSTINNAILAGVAEHFNFTVPIPAGVTQIALVFSYTTNGIAANNDFFTLSEVQLNLGPSVSAFEHLDDSIVLKQCEYYTYSDFAYGVAPDNAVGINTGETIMVATKAGALANASNSITHPTMRAAPVTTFYNPVNNNGNAYDENAAADCGVPVIVSSIDKGFNVVVVGNAGTVVGNRIGFHYFRDAELH